MLVIAMVEYFNTIPRIFGYVKSRLPGFCRCYTCGRAFRLKRLKYKRLLSRKQAERLEKGVILKSHFVYACPVCGGDVFDIKGRR
jgi:Zn finger protein HypA/HybF involved in hydrogenase expression